MLSKELPNTQQIELARILRLAERLRHGIQPDWFDFDQAKADVLQVTRL